MTMHVAVSGWLLGEPSGANRRLLALLAHAGRALGSGERITVLHRPDYAPPPLPGIGWRSIAVPASPTLARVRAERRTLADALRELGATLLDHGFLPLPRVHAPCCLLVHDVRGADGFGRWPRWLARDVLRRSCERAAVVVAPSAWTAARLRALAPRAREVAVVANGVDVPPPPPPLAPRALPAAVALPRTLPANGFVLHVGHVEPRKNLAVVVAALASLPAAVRPELWLAGRDAGALPSLRAAAASTVVVHALGAVRDATLDALYRAAHAVVIPSRHEGFGLPVLEGLARGARVLVSDAGALPEVAGEVATVLPADDAAAWAHALLAAPPAPPAAVGRHLDHFRWEVSAARLLAVWRRISG